MALALVAHIDFVIPSEARNLLFAGAGRQPIPPGERRFGMTIGLRRTEN